MAMVTSTRDSALPPAFEPSIVETLELRGRMIGALLLRETRTRFGRSRLGYVWALLEPIAHVGVMCLVYWTINRQAPVGPSVMLFFVTGVLPFFLFHKTALHLGNAIRSNQKVLRMPLLAPVDVIAARAVLEGMTWLVIAAILLLALMALGMAEWPAEPGTAALAALATFGLGLGIGLVNASLMVLVSSWVQVYHVLTRPLYIFSGIFYSIDQVPSGLQYWLSWNPLLHGVLWFRTGFRADYATPVLDEQYLLSWIGASVLLGLCLLRVARPRLAYA